MKTNIFALLCFVFIVSSCSDDEELPETNFIVMGNSHAVSIHPESKTVSGGYHQPITLDLDVNSDGINDYRLKSEVWGSPGLGQHPAAWILSLHPDALLSGTMTTDTTWLTKKITYSQEPGQPVVATAVLSYNCRRESPWSEIDKLQTNFFRLNYLTEGSPLLKTDVHRSDTLILTNEGMTMYFFDQLNDTIWNSKVTSTDDCWSIPADELRYIGLCLKEGGKMRLGWIKLKVKNNLEVFCAEWAIQP